MNLSRIYAKNLKLKKIWLILSIRVKNTYVRNNWTKMSISRCETHWSKANNCQGYFWVKKAYGESDHPDVDELYNRVSKIDPKISIATVYRTVKLFEEAGILTKHDFKGGKARYEAMIESHHDHLIDIKSGEIIEFVDEEIEKLQKKVAEKYGYKLVDHKLELYGVKVNSKDE